MTSTAERIKTLLGNGLSNEVVATAVGVTPSYVSQLLAEPEFADAVAEKRVVALSGHTLRDNSWDSLEDKLLATLHQKVDQNMIYKPNELLNALRVVNGAKRRSSSAPESIATQRPVVNLNLPTVILNQYKTSARGEVIEVETPEGDKQTLVTMSAGSLLAKLSEAAKGKQRVEQYEKVRRYLPASDTGEETA